MNKRPLLIILSILFFISCSRNEIADKSQNRDVPQETFITNIGTVMTGHIRVKLSEELEDSKSVLDYLSQINATSVSRTFPISGRFEKRHREEGLHLWYDIDFDPSVSITKASDDISKIDGVKVVEYLRKAIPSGEITYPFNDPGLNKQWHYYNPGTTEGYLEGSDINLFKAWEVNTGSDEVIVAVCDQGVKWNHEDLAENMWVNTAEYFGKPEVDDDNNGYVDDIYGFNFTTNNNISMYGEIVPGNHGTHVAGTIGAVNNNGKGYCGVAGGNGVKKGVRIMGCQMMEGMAFTAAAIIYGADNGAVISNNSWKSDSNKLEESLKEAIDYFIKYAGMDENGVQEGPMAGGIVIFAAGNDNTDWCYPAMYDKVMAVAAIGANYNKASYSNYGSWVDISAPGGDGSPAPYALVWSSYADGQYGAMGGTSQACPHVSGVAALVVSQFGGPGFTNDRLWNILLEGTRNIDEYNPGFAGQMGAGLIDAYKCLKSDDPNPPTAVDKIWTKAIANTIFLKWLVPNDDSGKASYFDIYSSEHSLADLDLSKPLPDGVDKTTVKAGVIAAGDTIKLNFPDLKFNTDYYFRIDAYDFSNNHSGLSAQVIQKTYSNNPPVITPIDGSSLSLRAFETKTLEFSINDPDGHEMIVDFNPASDAATLSRDEDILTIKVVGRNASDGSYLGSIKVSDAYNSEATQAFNYTIFPNHEPKVISSIPNTLISKKGEVVNIDLTKYFKDEDEEPLSYEVSSSSTNIVVETSISDNVLTLKGNWFGHTTISITAKDALEKSCSTSFEVLMRDGSREIDIFPNPVSDILHFRTSDDNNAQVSIFSASGAKVISHEVSIGPFSNGSVDVSSLSAGTYSVVISFEGKEIKRNIVKL